jgi:hypothetical protein
LVLPLDPVMLITSSAPRVRTVATTNRADRRSAVRCPRRRSGIPRVRVRGRDEQQGCTIVDRGLREQVTVGHLPGSAEGDPGVTSLESVLRPRHGSRWSRTRGERLPPTAARARPA